MKTLTLKNKQYTQRGFFDLGLSLALLSIFGGTAAVVSTEGKETVSYVEQQVNQESYREQPVLAFLEADDNC